MIKKKVSGKKLKFLYENMKKVLTSWYYLKVKNKVSLLLPCLIMSSKQNTHENTFAE